MDLLADEGDLTGQSEINRPYCTGKELISRLIYFGECLQIFSK